MRLVRPTSVADAVAVLAEPGAIVYAGGIEVMLALRSGAMRGDTLVDTKRIGGAAGVTGGAAEVHIGPATRHHDLAGDPLVRRHLPLLAAACGRVGTTRVRMQGTLGGNLAHGFPHTDPGTAALVYGGTVTLAGPSGSRTVDLGEFWLGLGRVARQPVELIADIALRPHGAGWSIAHERVEVLHRPPTVIISFAARMVGDRIRECRVAAGGIGDRPRRLVAMEGALAGCAAAEIETAVVDGAADLQPVSDLLGSADFKRRAVAGLVRRAAVRVCTAASREGTS